MYKNWKDVCQSHMGEWISKMEQMVLFGRDSDSHDCDDFDGDACDNCYYNVSVHQTRVMVGCQGRCYYYGVVHILRNHFWGSRERPPPPM